MKITKTFRALLVLLCVVMVFSLFACTEEVTTLTDSPATDAPTEEKTEEKTEAPTSEKTEAPTQEKTEAPTDEPTEAPGCAHEEVVLEGKAATCTEAGLTEGKKCSKCDEILVAQEEIPATGHTEVKVDAVAPTCQATGLTEGKKCSVCDTVLTAQEEVAIDPNAHNMDNGTPAEAAKCGDKATVTYKCLNAGCTHTNVVEGEELAHDMDEGSVTTAPTCTEKGVKTFACKRNCGHKTTEEVAALGHDMDTEGSVTTAPTCTDKGVKTFACKRNCGHSTTEEVAELGHDMDTEGSVTTAPTCTDKGVKTFACKRNCGHATTEEIPAAGHGTPAADAVWTVDVSAPQIEKTKCPNCDAMLERTANTTAAGLTLLSPEYLTAVPRHGNLSAVTLETDANGMKYYHAVGVAGKPEATLMLNGGQTAMKGVGNFIAVLARKNAGTSSIECWLNYAGTTSHLGSDGKKSTANRTSGVVINNQWHLVIFDYTGAAQMSKENGIGWTRFDIMNGTIVDGETVDIAFTGFFDTKDDIYAYYNLYIQAYKLDCPHIPNGEFQPSATEGMVAMTCKICGAECNVSPCAHSDTSKLSNITRKETPNANAFYSADCAACGKKGVDYTGLTQEGNKVFGGIELNSIAVNQASLGLENNAGFARYTTQLVVDDETVNNMPYARFTVVAAAEGCLFINDGTETLTEIDDYFVILYRKTGSGNAMQYFITAAGATSPTSNNCLQVNTVNDGTWQLAIFSLKGQTLYNKENGIGWSRIDIHDGGMKVGDVIDIAYAGYFSSNDAALEYYSTYIKAFLGETSCNNHKVAEWTVSETLEGHRCGSCSICGKEVTEKIPFSVNFGAGYCTSDGTTQLGTKGTVNDAPRVIDATGKTLTSATSLTLGGWCVTPDGLASIKFRVVSVDGQAVENPELKDFCKGGNTNATHDITKVGLNRGWTAQCGVGSAFQNTNSLNLTGYEGKKVNVEIVGVTTTGANIVIAQVNNIAVPSAQ